MIDFLANYWIDIALLIGGTAAWLLERYKRINTEVYTGQKLIAMYQSALKDFEIRYDLKIKNLESRVIQQQKELNNWKKKYNSLKREFDIYRQNHP